MGLGWSCWPDPTRSARTGYGDDAIVIVIGAVHPCTSVPGQPSPTDRSEPTRFGAVLVSLALVDALVVASGMNAHGTEWPAR